MADTKITALTENTTPEVTDLLVMVDNPEGTPVTQKMTIGTLLTTTDRWYLAYNGGFK
jgi:hypothetical protein